MSAKPLFNLIKPCTHVKYEIKRDNVERPLYLGYMGN